MSHYLDTDHGDMVAYPVVYLDAFHDWVRELSTRDESGWFITVAIATGEIVR